MFSDSNYRLFFGLVLDVLLKPWEKMVMTFKYSDVGLGCVLSKCCLNNLIDFLCSWVQSGSIGTFAR